LQSGPVYPLIQVQLKLAPSAVQIPPCLHGFG